MHFIEIRYEYMLLLAMDDLNLPPFPHLHFSKSRIEIILIFVLWTIALQMKRILWD